MTRTASTPSEDVLSDALDSLDAGGAVFFRGSLAAPWGVKIPDADRVLDLVGRPPGVDTVVMFHAVLRGAPVLKSGKSSLTLAPGDLVLLSLEEEHQLGEGRGGPRLTMDAIVRGKDLRNPLVFDAGPSGGTVKLICGGFFLRNTTLHPLLGALPPVTRVRSGERFDAVSILLRMLAQESDQPAMGSRNVVKRLADLLFVELLRAVMAEQSYGGWLAALRDPVLTRALAAIHGAPAASWTVPEIGRAAGVSASGLTQRFREVLRVSPSRYLANWRMHLASGLLQSGELSVAEVAERVGYGSVEAFSRTFKQRLGLPPGRWRDSS